MSLNIRCPNCDSLNYFGYLIDQKPRELRCSTCRARLRVKPRVRFSVEVLTPKGGPPCPECAGSGCKGIYAPCVPCGATGIRRD